MAGDVFQSVTRDWPTAAQDTFGEIRRILHETAAPMDGVSLVETLKWGQPSWLPDRPRIGSTLRVAWNEDQPDSIALFVNCKTNISDTMREIYPNAFTYDGKRGLRFSIVRPMPIDAIAHCAALTFTYHQNRS